MVTPSISASSHRYQHFAGEQHLETFLTVAGIKSGTSCSVLFLYNVYISIVIYYQDIEIAVGLRSFTGGCFCPLPRRGLASDVPCQRNGYLEAGTLDDRAVVAPPLVLRDLTNASQVQSYAFS